MFANRFTALVDACVLAGTLRRNLLLSLAAAQFFRVRWSVRILDETERAIAGQLAERGSSAPASEAARARRAMETAFEDAVVTGYERLEAGLRDLPDPDDAHVIAAAIQTRASVIVTDNTRDFPPDHLANFQLEAKTADAFLADTIDLDRGRAANAIEAMRRRFLKPALTQQDLLLRFEAQGLIATHNALREVWPAAG